MKLEKIIKGITVNEIIGDMGENVEDFIWSTDRSDWLRL